MGCAACKCCRCCRGAPEDMDAYMPAYAPVNRPLPRDGPQNDEESDITETATDDSGSPLRGRKKNTSRFNLKAKWKKRKVKKIEKSRQKNGEGPGSHVQYNQVPDKDSLDGLEVCLHYLCILSIALYLLCIHLKVTSF